MRAEQYVRNDRARDKVWLLRLDARINVVPDVAVRPAVESAILQRREIIGRKVIPQLVALVDGRPYFSRHRFQRQPHRIPQSRGVQSRVLAVRIADGHCRAARILSGVNIRFGANANEQMLSIRGKSQGSRLVPALWQVQQMFFFTEPLRRFGIVAKTHQFVHVSYVNVVCAKGDPERPSHVTNKNFSFLRPAGMLCVAQHDNFTGSGIG